jgi:hypothetical protein
MTVIYMDENMTLAAPKNKNQVVDIERWCPGVQIGEVVSSPLNPVLFSSSHEPFQSSPKPHK